jgi:proteic killer suppression protein
MILSFKGKAAEALYHGKRVAGIHPDVANQAVKKLFMLDTAQRVQDLRVPPGNRLEALTGDRTGQISIRVNAQFRICFTWYDGDAYDVEFVDYH